MGIFRRSMSSSSSRSRISTDDSSIPDTSTPRTSIDSDFDDVIADSLATIKPSQTVPSQTASLLTLPVELVQQITSYLDSPSAAAFCLSSRFVCYAVGTNHLLKYIDASKSRFEKRRTIEAVVERAFPGHWFCAWCDKFHAWHPRIGPLSTSQERKRDCAEFNSYLHDGSDYILCYHHVRLAVNRALWGPTHGLPLSAFTHTRSTMAKIFKTPVPTKLSCTARIASGRFLLHSSFAIILPAWSATNKTLLRHLWPTLPHILAGHRDSDHGHTGLMAALDNVVRRGWKYPFTQLCATCATDWSVSAHAFPHASGGQVRLVVQTWRDLGAGRNPFETSWRAHGVPAGGGAAGQATEVMRLTTLSAGEIRGAFESAGEKEKESGVAEGAERDRSTSRSRIYRAFMRREGEESGMDGGDWDVRRSRAARPRAWRTRSENEEVARQDEEMRREMAGSVAENLVRLDAERGRRM